MMSDISTVYSDSTTNLDFWPFWGSRIRPQRPRPNFTVTSKGFVLNQWGL